MTMQLLRLKNKNVLLSSGTVRFMMSYWIFNCFCMNLNVKNRFSNEWWTFRHLPLHILFNFQFIHSFNCIGYVIVIFLKLHNFVIDADYLTLYILLLGNSIMSYVSCSFSTCIWLFFSNDSVGCILKLFKSGRFGIFIRLTCRHSLFGEVTKHCHELNLYD